MLTSMLIIYLLGALVSVVVLQLIIDRIVERYSLLPSSVSLLWIAVFLIIGFSYTNIVLAPTLILFILYQVIMFFKYSKLEEIVTSKLIIRLDQQGFASTGNLAKCLQIDNNMEVLGRIVANMKARNKIPSDIEFDSSGGYVSKLQDGTEWNNTFCKDD